MKAPHEHPEDPKLLGWIFAAAQAGCGLRVCGWCRKFLGLARDLGAGQITHGLCPECEQKHFPKSLPAVDGSQSNQASAPAPSNRRPFSPAADHAAVFPCELIGAGFAAPTQGRLPVVFADAEKFKPEVRK